MLRKILSLLLFPAALHAQSNPYELDSTFGTNGITTFPQISAVNPYGMQPAFMIEQADRKLLLLSRSYLSSPSDIPLLRVKPNGKADSTTGVNGIAVMSLNDIVDFIGFQQVSNGILIGGVINRPSFSQMHVIKLDNNLNFDQSFGNNGRASFGFGDPFQLASAQMVVQPDEKIIIGSSTIRNSAAVTYLPAHGRLLPGGSLDPAYGVGGKVEANYTNAFPVPAGQALDCRVMAMAMQADGKLLVGGRINSTANPTHVEGFMVRHNADGSLDSTFGTNGLCLTGTSISVARKILLDSQSNIYFVGDELTNNQEFISVWKYSPAGVQQLNYGTAGVLHVGHGLASSFYSSTGLVMDQSGRFYIAGNLDVSTATPSFLLACYNKQGQPDLAFAPNGAVITPRDSADVCVSLVLQADSGLVLSAFNKAGMAKIPMVMRFKRRGSSPAAVETVGMAENTALQIYPNPSPGVFTCVFHLAQKGAATLSVLNALGQTVFQEEINNTGNKTQINLPAAMPAGVYQVRVQNGTEVANAALMLTR